MCVWSMEALVGLIWLPGEPANTSTSSSSNVWIITLSICHHQHLSAPQEEPVTHSSVIPVALCRLAYTSRGLSAPEGLCYIYNSICIPIWKKKKMTVRGWAFKWCGVTVKGSFPTQFQLSSWKKKAKLHDNKQETQVKHCPCPETTQTKQQTVGWAALCLELLNLLPLLITFG